MVALAEPRALESATARSPRFKVGILAWPQATDWASLVEVGRRIDQAGYDSLWTWDHLYAIVGPPEQPIFEGWSTLMAWAMVTERVELGLQVGAIPFRNPGVVAKTAVTLDHASGGRAWLGVGGAWFAREHEAYDIYFGEWVGQRLDWMDEACAAYRAWFSGEAYTSPPGGHYDFRDAVVLPFPVRERLPIMIGGAGRKKTLRTVAKYADGWNANETPETMAELVDVLANHCADVGRDPAEIERTFGPAVIIRDDPKEAARVYEAALAHNQARPGERLDPKQVWLGPPDLIAERCRPVVELGFSHLIAELPSPFDLETVERLVEVRDLITGS
jgi:alkanesulfonate monooxygenase SsuD/methylene tetrahydromethanopterin reductase-like flavin-dependent oxidoreductase (luciferase family)